MLWRWYLWEGFLEVVLWDTEFPLHRPDYLEMSADTEARLIDPLRSQVYSE